MGQPKKSQKNKTEALKSFKIPSIRDEEVFDAEFTWKIPDFILNEIYIQNFDLAEIGVKMIVRMAPRLNRDQLLSSTPIVMFHDANSKANGKLGQNPMMNFIASTSDMTVRIKPTRLEFGKPFWSNSQLVKEKFVSRCCVNGVLELKIHVSITTSVEKEDVLARDFGKFLGDKNFSDFTFHVDGDEIHAHKAILAARSPFFKKMLTAGEPSYDNFMNDIKDISKEAFTDYLSFLYTGEVSNFEKHLMSLLSISARFENEELKEECAGKLLNKLNSDNAAKLYELSHRYQLSQELKKKSFAMIQHVIRKFNQHLDDNLIDKPEEVLLSYKLAMEFAESLKRAKTQQRQKNEIKKEQIVVVDDGKEDEALKEEYTPKKDEISVAANEEVEVLTKNDTENEDVLIESIEVVGNEEKKLESKEESAQDEDSCEVETENVVESNKEVQIEDKSNPELKVAEKLEETHPEETVKIGQVQVTPELVFSDTKIQTTNDVKEENETDKEIPQTEEIVVKIEKTDDIEPAQNVEAEPENIKAEQEEDNLVKDNDKEAEPVIEIVTNTAAQQEDTKASDETVVIETEAVEATKVDDEVATKSDEENKKV